MTTENTSEQLNFFPILLTKEQNAAHSFSVRRIKFEKDNDHLYNHPANDSSFGRNKERSWASACENKNAAWDSVYKEYDKMGEEKGAEFTAEDAIALAAA